MEAEALRLPIESGRELEHGLGGSKQSMQAGAMDSRRWTEVLGLTGIYETDRGTYTLPQSGG